MSDITENLTPEQQVAREEIDKAFEDLMNLPSGRRVLFWMLEQCAIYENAYAGENTSATNFALGRQDAGRRLIAKLDEIDPWFYPKLLIDIAEMKAMDRAAANARAGKTEIEDDED